MTLLGLFLFITAASSALGQRQPQQPRGCVVDNIDTCRYESHREMIDRFMRIQRNFPHIAKVRHSFCLLGLLVPSIPA